MDALYTNSEKDIYIIPATKRNLCLFYSPLRDIFFACDKSLCPDIIQYFEKGIVSNNKKLQEYICQIESSPIRKDIPTQEFDTEDRAVIILTQKCNLACSYCYAQQSRTQDVLSFEKVRIVIDHIFSTNNGKKKLFSFIGGGEPLMCWKTLQNACDYIKEKSKQTSLAYSISIITNATLLTEEKVKWISENKINVSVSFDVLPNIQNIQRPFAFKKSNSFDAVDSAIRLLNQYGVRFKTRTTITDDIVDKMPEMVDFITEQYPFLHSLHLEPVTDANVNYNIFFKKYQKFFMEAYILGKVKGVSVENSLTHAILHIKNFWCRGELCITPNGLVSACHRHSNQNDQHYVNCLYGSIEHEQLNINNKQLETIIHHRKSYSSNCKECFVKWHCAGGCFSQNMTFNLKQHKEYCRYVKSFSREYLEKQIIDVV